eukprot:scaffold48310_cov35-Prasinocladus_malaysianus.AAC.2
MIINNLNYFLRDFFADRYIGMIATGRNGRNDYGNVSSHVWRSEIAIAILACGMEQKQLASKSDRDE